MSIQLYNIYLKSNVYVTARGNFDPAARPEIQIFDLQKMRMCLYDSFTSRKMVFDNGVGGGGWMGVGDEFYVFFIYINRQRYRIFLFPRKSSFLRIYEEY